MNKCIEIGNLVRDPELRQTGNGTSVCNFTIAVNRRRRGDQGNDQPSADFFNVAAWRERGELCAKYLSKGKKVCVIGPVSVRTYQANDGTTKAQLEITADEVEFLSSRGESEHVDSDNSVSQPATTEGGFTAVETDELPFDHELAYS